MAFEGLVIAEVLGAERVLVVLALALDEPLQLFGGQHVSALRHPDGDQCKALAVVRKPFAR